MRNLPDGFDTVVGERGRHAHRAASASASRWRARSCASRVCSILDDATASVDPSVEAQILAALREELRTTLS